MSQLVQLQNNEYSPEQIKLITDTVARGATKDELQLFLYRAKSLGLDPLKPGQIYFIKYGSSPGTIVVGIDGFRAKAVRTGKLSGISRGVLRDEKGKCIGAFAEVQRSDWTKPAREEVSLAEYNTGKGNWVKMPETMIKKVAEAAALRMAFPDDLGGVYSQEEMEQAEKDSHRVVPQQPEAGDGIQDPADLVDVIMYGKYAKRRLHTIDPKDLDEYYWSVVERQKTDPRLQNERVNATLKQITEYLASLDEIPEADAEVESTHAGEK